MDRYEAVNSQAVEEGLQEELPFHRLRMTGAVWAALRAAKANGLIEPLPVTGQSSGEAAAWRLYAPLLNDSKVAPFVFAQIGQSLDGRVATVDGDARDVSGRGGLEHLHRCRALADAVVIGVSTALKDDPRLTVRLVEGEDPARVVIDPAGRLGNEVTLLRDSRGVRRLIVQACDKARPPGVEVVRLEMEDGRLPPQAIIAALAKCGLRRILVEGGATTIGRFVDAGVVRRLHVCVSPLLIGAGPCGLATTPTARLADALRPTMRVFALGGDLLFDCALDQPPGSASTSKWPTTQALSGSAAVRL